MPLRRIEAASFDSTDCSTGGCPNESDGPDGRCSHCRRWVKEPPVRLVQREERHVNVTCKVEGCTNVAPTLGRYAGYCPTHRAHGVRDQQGRKKPKRTLTAVPAPAVEPVEAGPLLAELLEAQPAFELAEEAAGVVRDRMASYGAPADNHACTAGFWTDYLRRRGLLAEGAELDPEDVCWLNVLQKISRQAHVRKRDNRVDVIGFAINAELVEPAEAGT